MTRPAMTPELQQTAFRPLQQTAFQGLQQGASLKGLLKPFKGKGELEQLAELCGVIEGELKQLAQDVLGQARQRPFSLLPVRLIEQNTGSGTMFLRWQHVQSRRMGVGIWSEMLLTSKLSENLLHDLVALEHQRITLNMQISLIHSIGKQAAECSEKVAQADAVLMKRLQQFTNQPETH